MLDLDGSDLDAPCVRLHVEDLLNVLVQTVALRQHLVQIVLAEHGSQRRLGELARRGHEILDLDRRFLRVDDAEIDHSADPHRNIVARDHVLAGHVENTGPEIDAHHLLHIGEEQDQPRSLDAGETAEREDHAAFIFPEDPDRKGDDDQQEQERGGKGRKISKPGHERSPFPPWSIGELVRDAGGKPRMLFIIPLQPVCAPP